MNSSEKGKIFIEAARTGVLTRGLLLREAWDADLVHFQDMVGEILQLVSQS